MSLNDMWVYELNKEGVISLLMHIHSSIVFRLKGIPRLKGKNLKEIAEKIIKDNAGEVLIAGKSHFRYMWTVDFAKAFVGVSKVLPKDYLQKQLQRIIDESYKKGYVPTCFSKSGSFNMPFKRADNFPWMIKMIHEYAKKFREENFVIKNKIKLKKIYSDYINTYFDKETYLIKTNFKFDWMDSVLRPSSTYVNMCLLNMFNLCKGLNLNIKTFESETESALMKRWTGQYFLDFDKSQDYISADANIPALYFNLFSKKIRKIIYNSLEKSGLTKPIPMKMRVGNQKIPKHLFANFAPNYHDVIWTHLGLMYLNGLKRNKFDYKKHLKKMEKSFWQEKNIIETFDLNGKPFATPLLVTEHNFLMAAGQYLELVN